MKKKWKILVLIFIFVVMVLLIFSYVVENIDPYVAAYKLRSIFEWFKDIFR